MTAFFASSLSLSTREGETLMSESPHRQYVRYARRGARKASIYTGITIAEYYAIWVMMSR
jgi:vacuolar-type H+-ATPase catalytic subunit A/Vma1